MIFALDANALCHVIYHITESKEEGKRGTHTVR